MAQNSSADLHKVGQDQEATFSIEGWFSGKGNGAGTADPAVAASDPAALGLDDADIEITPGVEIDPFNWSNTFLKVYREFELLEQLAANAQNPMVIRKLASMEDALATARSEADLLPLPKLRIRLEEVQATHMYSTDRQERVELSEQLSMLRLNVCSQALVRLAIAEFYNRVGDKDLARQCLHDAELRANQLTEISGELECVDYLMKVQSEIRSD